LQYQLVLKDNKNIGTGASKLACRNKSQQ
jgi:hypothetical protein